ncbi:sciellin isoform X2 [Salarias fasciatus]|uniref:sciellin isoform X2 n=1 Tax=Salarias fasciatus TaxID=181472 RepID=UPI001176F55F|nr:sciellin isoform X2 [Salarias fasciatus]
MYPSKTSGLLKDNSWIKKQDDEDEDIDRDPNYGRSILRGTSDDSDDNEETISKSVSTSVEALQQRFGGSPTDLGSSTTTTTYSRDGKSTMTTETTVTRSTVNKTSSTKTFTERVLSSSKGAQYSTYSPPKTTEVTKKAITSTSDAEDHLYDSLVPSATKSTYSPTDSKTTVTVKSSGDLEAEDNLYDRLIPQAIKDEAASGRTSSTSETVTVRSSSIRDDDDLYNSLRTKSSDFSSLNRGESPTVTSSTSIRSYSSYTEDSPITSTTSYTISTKPGYDYSSTTSPTSYTSTTYRSSRSDDSLSDPIYSKSSTRSVYSSSDRTLLEKDLCTTCRKPFTGDAKMVLEDINVNCHASCFKCDVCSSTLGHLKAGDSMWVYRGMVHCENCFEVTRAKWRR